MESNAYRILDTIRGEADVRALPREDIPALCGELRDFLVENVTKTGGHLASNLGVVELTVALHRVFDLPHDRVIFDVGHQSYVHKILSDRKDRFSTLRRGGGISGFEKLGESPFDAFGTGHASTSVSAALGYAEADRMRGSDNYTVAVLGDGAFTGGMVHEALNNCRPDLRLIVVLNENEMSISRNTGALARHIAKMRSSGGYFRFKRGTKSILSRVPLIGTPLLRGVRRLKHAAKGALYGTSYFEGLGLKYLGPVDGNDYDAVENLLEEAKRRQCSVVLHLRTVKGKGYAPAEENPSAYHMVGSAYANNFSEHFGSTLCQMAKKDDKVCAITAAMQVGVGLSEFAARYPDRFFDVGIAEEHAVTFAAGLAAAGMKPYVAIYSTFLQRSYDNILHDVALQKLPVRFLVDRAALAGGDGPTHHGIFDVAYLSTVPNLCLFAPATFASLDRFLAASLSANMPMAIRYPNTKDDARITETFFADGSTDTVAHADFTDPAANRAVILTYGRIVTEAMTAAEKLRAQGIPTGVILLETLKPYDVPADRIASLLPSSPAAIVFLEEGIKNGGAGMLTLDKLCERHAARMQNKKTKVLAIDDNFVIRTQEESIYRTAKISANDVLRTMVHLLASLPAEQTADTAEEMQKVHA
ncbi:MAG: 1-deoxy-D-xylulose-5-phosphate synthase [Clostridia bacterium]|nr:1-deoxy-D-xylulose-5-phosphate synthase [Clostridia bacterium]